MNNFVCLLSVCFFLFLSSCDDGKDQRSLASLNNDRSENAFELNGQFNLSDGSNKSNIIGIKKSSLQQEFLLQASLIVQPMLPSFNGLKSRIVSFQKVDNFLYMMEASKEHVITKDIPQNLVIARFPIVEVNENTIFFDFVEGMNKIFVASDWYAHDIAGSFYRDSWSSVDVDISYLESAKIDEHNNLILRQVAQLITSDKKGNDSTPTEIRYYFSNYKENKDFPSVRTNNFKHMGFFETSPVLNLKGEHVVHASKFDIRNPIVFAISANTPQAYKEAIRSGALYWNKAFNKEIVKVVDAPIGVTAPDFNHNLIQWVDWEDAGYAYADAQMDPRTGEIIHAQVFLTSAFAFSGVGRARRLLKRLQEQQNNTNFHNHDKDHSSHTHTHKHKHKHISLAGFQNQHLCDYRPDKSMISDLVSLLADTSNLNEAKFLQVSQDYVREVVAHEIGHTLGLRHNFAGSLAANYPQSQTNDLFKSYIKTGEVASDVVTSSSVMEYQRFKESAMTGRMIANNSMSLEYDKKTIEYLYYNKSYTSKELPFFCTDSDLSRYLDCKVFDSGRSFVKQADEDDKAFFRNIPYLLMEQYLMAKYYKEKNKLESLAQATISPYYLADLAFQGKVRILRGLDKKSAFLKVRNKINLTDINYGTVRLLEQEYVVHLIKQAGGIKSLFKLPTAKEVKELKVKFYSLLDSPIYSQWRDEEGNLHDITNEDKAEMKQAAKQLFAALPAACVYTEMNVFDSVDKFIDHSIIKDLEDVVVSRVIHIVLATSKAENFTLNDENKTVLKIPKFVFSNLMRMKAVKLLEKKNIMWGLKNKKKIAIILEAILNRSLKNEIGSVDELAYPDTVTKWIIENREILQKLDS